jgi:hypothetical protein
LDQQKVAVHLQVQGREELMIGVGEYEIDPDLGGVLRVQTSPGEDTHFLFLEREWTGKIRRGTALGCDFLIRLS